MKQRDIAEKAGSASQTINAIVHGRKVAGLQKQEEIAVACGYEYVDFLLLGRRLLGGKNASAPTAPTDGEMSHESARIAVTALVDQMVAAEEKLSFWRTAIITAANLDKK